MALSHHHYRPTRSLWHATAKARSTEYQFQKGGGGTMPSTTCLVYLPQVTWVQAFAIWQPFDLPNKCCY